jgi:hypothetical protein
MSDNATLRTTTGIVDRVEPNGVVFVHEIKSHKIGFLANNTPVEGNVRLKPGTQLWLDVEDKGDVMVVAAARLMGG